MDLFDLFCRFPMFFYRLNKAMGPEQQPARIVSYPEGYLCSALSVIVPLEGALKFKNRIPR